MNGGGWNEKERLRAEGRQYLNDKDLITSRLVPGSPHYGKSLDEMLARAAAWREGADPFDILERLKAGTIDDPAGENIVPEADYNRIRNMENLYGMINRALFQRMAKGGKFQQSPQGGYLMPDDVGRKWIK